ncbi:MAG TPA: CDP-archaeol synthase [Burkholderiales bacterium]|nr:CDP-archaeol synthase [Burkholderiales bacterium]
MFARRLLTAAALLGAFLGALFCLDRASFAAIVALVVALAAHEWARLCGLRGARAAGYAAACGALLLAVSYAGALREPAAWAAAAFWALVVPAWLAKGVSAGARTWLLAAGLAVLAPAGAAMVALPPVLALLTLGLVWVADTAAYLAGTAYGRRRLAPSISPGKTWEGVAGGVVGSVIYAIICAMFSPSLGRLVQGAIWVAFLAGALLLCAASIVGDLFESALKRQAGAKDSGTLLPGHGGVLDRIDSATAALPVALLLLQALGAT